MEAVLQLGQWVGRASWDPVLIPVLAAARSARPGAGKSSPFPTSVSQQPALFGFVLCVGAALSVLLLGLG